MPLWSGLGVPDLSPHALALFRIVFGITMMVAAARLSGAPSAPGLEQAPGWLARAPFIHSLLTTADGIERVRLALIACLALFTMGVVPRIALAGAATLYMLVGALLLAGRGIPDVALSSLAMVLMTVAPWHVGFGVSSGLRRWRGRPEPETSLAPGLALWFARLAVALGVLVTLVGGVHGAGLGWLTDGAVAMLTAAFWSTWWPLLLGFLPWQAFGRIIGSSLPRVTVLADGECPMCRRAARTLHALDWFDRLDFADASNDQERHRVAPHLDRDRALAEMYVIDQTGQQTAGYDGYLRLSVSLPLLWIPGVIGRILPVAALGRWTYGLVAASRTRVGRCTDEICDVAEAPLPRRVQSIRPL